MRVNDAYKMGPQRNLRREVPTRMSLRPGKENHEGDHPQRGSDVRTGRRWALAHRTSRLQGAIQRSRNVGGYGQMGHLAAATVDLRRLASVDDCGRWLPVWLPEITGWVWAGYKTVAARPPPSATSINGCDLADLPTSAESQPTPTRTS